MTNAAPQRPHRTGLRLAELDPARGKHVSTPWGPFALYLVDGEVLCAQAFCPHMDGPLFEGTLTQGANGEASIVCPWHLWRYDVRTGKRVDLAGLMDRRCLTRLAATIDHDGTILLAPCT
jgi:nitrite reductase/ring-hydroxylating ferredoxin subunit